MNVFVTEAVRKKNPKFSQLVDIIEKKDEDILSEIKSKLWLAKSEWLEKYILLNAVQVVLNNMEVKMLNHNLHNEDEKSWKAVDKCFTISHCCSCVLHDESTTILQLNAKKLKLLLEEHEEDLKKGKKLLANEVEKYLESHCIKLANIRDGDDAPDNLKIQFARGCQIGDILSNDKFSLLSCQRRIKELLIKEMNMKNEYHLELEECSDVLIKIITKYCLRLQPHKDQTIAKNVIISCQTLAAKLKSIRMELKCETYTPKQLNALRQLRAEITDTIKHREIESSDIEQQLEIYRRLGSDFEAIATEYGETKNNIEKQTWTLNEIKQKMGSDG